MTNTNTEKLVHDYLNGHELTQEQLEELSKALQEYSCEEDEGYELALEYQKTSYLDCDSSELALYAEGLIEDVLKEKFNLTDRQAEVLYMFSEADGERIFPFFTADSAEKFIQYKDEIAVREYEAERQEAEELWAELKRERDMGLA